MVADPFFEDPRLAQVYDLLHPGRPDLYAYLALAGDFGARQVLDIGCGTGTFACLLADHGFDVTAVDPAAASLDVARRKLSANRVGWHLGDTSEISGIEVDLATMTGNVAQVFLTDDAWSSTLQAAHDLLRPGGRLIFEVRNPEKGAWRGWTRERSYRCLDLPEVGRLETWTELTEVALPLVTFRHQFVFHRDGLTMTSDSTLRFREQSEIERSLVSAGYQVDEVRDAPDRPGLELVFIAARQSSANTASRKQRTGSA